MILRKQQQQQKEQNRKKFNKGVQGLHTGKRQYAHTKTTDVHAQREDHTRTR